MVVSTMALKNGGLRVGGELSMKTNTCVRKVILFLKRGFPRPPVPKCQPIWVFIFYHSSEALCKIAIFHPIGASNKSYVCFSLPID